MCSLSFRTRLAFATGAAVAVTVILASLIAYSVVANNLVGQIDDGLRSQLLGLREHNDHGGGHGHHGGELPSLSRGPFDTSNFAQFVSSSGAVNRAGSEVGQLPTTDTSREVARGTHGTDITNMTVQGIHLRVLTGQVGSGLAVQ